MNIVDMLKAGEYWQATTTPYTSLMGEGFFALFGGLVVMTTLYISSEDITLPSVVGLLIGGACIVFLPAAAQAPTYVLLIIGVAGVFYRLLRL